jgi:hypothetical protein
MKGNRVLAVVSAAQLASGLGGMALAIRRRHAFDIPFWKGQPSTVARDSVLVGTALSAPLVMLAAQAGATVALCSGGRARQRNTRWAGWAPRWRPGTWLSGWYGSGSHPPAGIQQKRR